MHICMRYPAAIAQRRFAVFAEGFEEDLDEMKISLEKIAFKKQDPLAIIEALRKLKGVREVDLLIN